MPVRPAHSSTDDREGGKGSDETFHDKTPHRRFKTRQETEHVPSG
jgi:hypothetical protein